MDRIGQVPWTGQDRIGQDRSGTMDRTSTIDRIGQVTWTGQDRIGQVRYNGQDRTSTMDRIGQVPWTGQDRIGRDRYNGQDTTGIMDRTGHDRIGQDRTGQDRTGTMVPIPHPLTFLYWNVTKLFPKGFNENEVKLDHSISRFCQRYSTQK